MKLLSLLLAMMLLAGCAATSPRTATPTPASTQPPGPGAASGGGKPQTGTPVRAPRLLLPDEAKQIRDLPNADSIWLYRVTETKDGWTSLYVWTGLGLPDGADIPFIALYSGGGGSTFYMCPRKIGHLTIRDISGDDVQFAAANGPAGSFHLPSQTWSFAP